MRRAWRWGLAGAALLLGVAAVAIATAPPPSAVPWHFWIRSDADTKQPFDVYPVKGKASDPRWTAKPLTNGSTFPTLREVRDHPSFVTQFLRSVGLLNRGDGHLIAVQMVNGVPGNVWLECVTTNASWPEDAVIDPAFAGTWEETNGITRGRAPAPTIRRTYAADGSIVRADWPGLKARWARIGDVVVIGVWDAKETRWHTGDAVIVAPDGESYRATNDATGRRVR